ncbi:MAG: hypothetical protein GTO12_06880 [Proteobacteria bacterium]|nr:hypothetical protein [Pseudomonadota bacterium]
MKGERDFSLFVALVVGIQTAGIAVAGLFLKVGEKAILWLIFGAIVAIGLAILRGQAAGLGRIMDILAEIRADRPPHHPETKK